MSKKRLDKKITVFEPVFQDVLVCRKNDCRPYVEIFVQKPENVDQENLGTLFGVLEITDFSEDSSYIVNYLVSVIKKEYFSRPKRGAIESFEASLHKVNLALSKLAEHENIAWIGNINAVLAAIEKNNIHLSQTGNAKPFLLRSKVLTDISDNSPEQVSEPNPFKTFEDVLSGRLEEGDKLIITTDSVFEIFSQEEIKRSAIKFGKNEFLRFLKTALSNELERSAVLIIDIEMKEEEVIIHESKKYPANAFSQDTFRKGPPRTDRLEREKGKAVDPMLMEKIQAETEKLQGEFVDKKTGHIYIKEDSNPEDTGSLSGRYLNDFKELLGTKFEEGIGLTKKTAGRISRWRNRKSEQERTSDDEGAIPQDTKAILGPQKKIRFDIPNHPKMPALGKMRPAISSMTETSLSYSKRSMMAVKTGFIPATGRLLAFLRRAIITGVSGSLHGLKFIMPNLQRLGRYFQGLDRKRKITISLATLAVLTIPYLIVRIEKKQEKQVTAPVETPTPQPIPLENDKNVVRIETLSNSFDRDDIVNIINLNNKLFAVTNDSVINIENGSASPLPENFQDPLEGFEMDDLNLIFILGRDGSIVAWSPTAGKFQENSLDIPSGSHIVSAKTYLTYIYLLDPKGSQIYRYPRAEGGFGAKSNWIKDGSNFPDAKDFCISDNIYIASGQDIFKYFQGKRQDFKLEETATPVAAAKIYTKSGWENIFILDRVNSRIIKITPDGRLISQYHNAELNNIKDFTVNNETNTLYFATQNSVKSFEMKDR